MFKLHPPAPAELCGLSPLTIILIVLGATVSILMAIWQQFHAQIVAFFDDLNAKTGIITFLQQAWDQIVQEFDDKLLPALQKLWTALQPLMPFLQAMAVVIGATLLGAIVLLVDIMTTAITLFANILIAATNLATFFTNVLVKSINAVESAFNSVFNSPAFKAVSGLLGGAVSGISSAVNAVAGAAGSILKVNDAIITPGGQVIQTDVADYLFATKNPGAIGGAAGGGTGAINIYIQGGSYFKSGWRADDRGCACNADQAAAQTQHHLAYARLHFKYPGS